MRIVVTGSIGNISRPIAKTLVHKAHATVVISSNGEKQKEIESIGAIPAIGSLDDPDFLASVFDKADLVYAMIPPDFSNADPLAHYKKIGESYAKAIRQAGVKRIVQLSSWGAHLEKGTGVIVGSYHVEQILNALNDISITYLRPASFYTNLYHYIGMIKNTGMIGTNYGGENKLVMVAAEDIAQAAVQEIEAPAAFRKIRYVASDERTCNEVATALGTAIGQPDLKWVTFSDQQTKDGMVRNGIAESLADKLVELNASIRTGLIRSDYDLHEPSMGKTKIEDFAKDFATVYHQR